MPAVGQSALEDGHFPRCRVFARPEKVRDGALHKLPKLPPPASGQDEALQAAQPSGKLRRSPLRASAHRPTACDFSPASREAASAWLLGGGWKIKNLLSLSLSLSLFALLCSGDEVWAVPTPRAPGAPPPTCCWGGVSVRWFVGVKAGVGCTPPWGQAATGHWTTPLNEHAKGVPPTVGPPLLQ